MKYKCISSKKYFEIGFDRKKFTGLIYTNGYDILYAYEGRSHRIDGPAYIKNTYKEYWIYDKKVTKEQQEFLYDLLILKGIL